MIVMFKDLSHFAGFRYFKEKNYGYTINIANPDFQFEICRSTTTMCLPIGNNCSTHFFLEYFAEYFLKCFL